MWGSIVFGGRLHKSIDPNSVMVFSGQLVVMWEEDPFYFLLRPFHGHMAHR